MTDRKALWVTKDLFFRATAVPNSEIEQVIREELKEDA